MIKQLITDLAYDNIGLSKALTRAKIIATKIDSSELKLWLKNELEGYAFDDTQMPKYRKVNCTFYLVAEFPFGRQETFPISFGEENDNLNDINNVLKYHRVTEPIAAIEQNMERLTSAKGNIPLSPEQVEFMGKPFKSQVGSYRGIIKRGYIEVAKVQYENIIDQTKQKLLDTLLELDKQFPNLEDNFLMTKANAEQVQTIITNNIYGNNNPLNLAAGQNVEQKDITVVYTLQDYQKLKDLGVEEDKIEELQSIVRTEKDKPTLKSKVFKWLGSVTTSLAARGLYDNIPAITEFIEKLI